MGNPLGGPTQRRVTLEGGSWPGGGGVPAQRGIDITLSRDHVKAVQMSHIVFVVDGPSSRPMTLAAHRGKEADPALVSAFNTLRSNAGTIEHSSPAGICPADKVKLTIVVGNLAVGEQIGELYVHCRFGIKEESGSLCVDPTGCPQTVRLNCKK